MAYESHTPRAASGDLRFCVPSVPDGMHWHPSARNPLGVFLEMTGLTKWNGLFYYLTGQPNLTGHRGRWPGVSAPLSRPISRRGSPCAAVGLERSSDLTGPPPADNAHQLRKSIWGPGLWESGHVLLDLRPMAWRPFRGSPPW